MDHICALDTDFLLGIWLRLQRAQCENKKRHKGCAGEKAPGVFLWLEEEYKIECLFSLLMHSNQLCVFCCQSAFLLQHNFVFFVPWKTSMLMYCVWLSALMKHSYMKAKYLSFVCKNMLAWLCPTAALHYKKILELSCESSRWHYSICFPNRTLNRKRAKMCHGGLKVSDWF